MSMLSFVSFYFESIVAVCRPFWTSHYSLQTTHYTYASANTHIGGDSSRSACVWIRASAFNVDNIIFSIGSPFNTFSGGCNQHFALAIADSSYLSIYGMCPFYDNHNFYAGPGILHDGNFHQICVTYETVNAVLCTYVDLQPPQCIVRPNPRYNTYTGDVRIGWWIDSNRGFTGTGGGLIKLLSLYNYAVNQACVNYLYQLHSTG